MHRRRGTSLPARATRRNNLSAAHVKRITQERAERIAKAHACENCGEYNYKRVSVKPASKAHQETLGVAWTAEKVCGVCDAHHEVGISDQGEIVYVS
jgi:hypothetical protein